MCWQRIVKRNFYRRFGFIYTMWFLQMPILVLISRMRPPSARAADGVAVGLVSGYGMRVGGSARLPA